MEFKRKAVFLLFQSRLWYTDIETGHFTKHVKGCNYLTDCK